MRGRLINVASSEKHNKVKVDPVFQGVEWLSIRPKIKNAPRIVRPGPVD